MPPPAWLHRAFIQTRHAAKRDTPFEQAVLPHLGSAYNLARWLVRDPALADDVVQDAVLRALGYFASFRGGNARAWLMHIVRNVAYDAIAARARVAPLPDTQSTAAEPADPAPDPEAAMTAAQRGMIVQRALDALPDELRECLVLRELEDLSYKEIAQVTGVPAGTVMSRLWRARRALAGSAVLKDVP